MKWIKLFEQYTQGDKVEAANFVWLVFDYKNKLNIEKMKKIEDYNGNIYYYEQSSLETLQSGRIIKPELRIIITHDEIAYINFTFLSGDLLKSLKSDFDASEFNRLTIKAAKNVLDCKGVVTYDYVDRYTKKEQVVIRQNSDGVAWVIFDYERRFLALLSGSINK